MTFGFETPREHLRRQAINRTKTAALIGASTLTLLIGCGSLRPPATHQTPAPAASGQEARDGKLGFTVTARPGAYLIAPTAATAHDNSSLLVCNGSPI